MTVTSQHPTGSLPKLTYWAIGVETMILVMSDLNWQGQVVCDNDCVNCTVKWDRCGVRRICVLGTVL